MKSRSDAAGIPQQPLCPIGAQVMVIANCESRVTASYGTVTGLEYDPPDAMVQPCWWYAVQFTSGHDVGHRDWVPEEKLIPLTIATQGRAV